MHPTLLRHPNPKNVFIGGGGELATARECLRHSAVEHVTMCDLDKLVVDTCRTQMPEWNDGESFLQNYSDNDRLITKSGVSHF